MVEPFTDPYREYPTRLIGYVNAVVRPWKDLIPKQAYQASLGVMHTFFLTNAYDYAKKVDSKSPTSSALDCYTWHCCASWLGPAFVVDHTVRFAKKRTSHRLIPILLGYAALGVSAQVMDGALNWYFYGFLGAGNKDRPRLHLN